MLPNARYDAGPHESRTRQTYEDQEFAILFREMQVMLDRIADCWRTDLSANAACVAMIASDVARSGLETNSVTADGSPLDSLRKEVGHILAARHVRSRRS